MSELVDPTQIERIVGARRHPTSHLARLVTSRNTVYILHSQQCKDTGRDLRTCPYSIALDAGLQHDAWRGFRDRAVIACITLAGRLTPVDFKVTTEGATRG